LREFEASPSTSYLVLKYGDRHSRPGMRGRCGALHYQALSAHSWRQPKVQVLQYPVRSTRTCSSAPYQLPLSPATEITFAIRSAALRQFTWTALCASSIEPASIASIIASCSATDARRSLVSMLMYMRI